MILTRAVGVIIALVAVVYPVYTVAPVAAMTEQRGYMLVIQDACDLLGPQAAVVILHTEPNRLALDTRLPQSLRGWCGADVAMMTGLHGGDTLRRLSREWKATGRKLFVVAESSATIRAVLPDAPIRATRVVRNAKMLKSTLTKRPDKYQAQSFSMLIARVPNS